MLSILLMLLSMISCAKMKSFKHKVKYHHEEGIIKGKENQDIKEYFDEIEKLVSDLKESKRLGDEFEYGISTDRGVETIKMSFPMLLMLGFKEDMPFDDFTIKDSEGNIIKRKGRDSIFIDLIEYMVNKSQRFSLEGNYIDINKRYVGIPLLDFIVAKYSNRILEAFLQKTYTFVNFVEAVDNVLILAIAKGDRERLEILLRYMYKRDEETGDGIIDKFASVPDELAFAISNKDIDLANILVNYGFSLNDPTVRGFKVSDYCGVNACEDGMKYCLAKGATYRSDKSILLEEVKVVTFGGMLTAIGITTEVIGDMHGIFVLSLVGDAMVGKITDFFGLSIDLDLIKLINKNFNLIKKRGDWALGIDFNCESDSNIRMKLLKKLKNMIDELKSKDKLLSKETREKLTTLSTEMKTFIKTNNKTIKKDDHNREDELERCNQFKGKYRLLFEDIKRDRKDNILVKGKRRTSKIEKRVRKAFPKQISRNSLSFKSVGNYIVSTTHKCCFPEYNQLLRANSAIGMNPATLEEIDILKLDTSNTSYWTGNVNKYGFPHIVNFKDGVSSSTYMHPHFLDQHLCLFVRER